MKKNIRRLTIILFLFSICACQGKKQEKEQKEEQTEDKFGTIDLDNPDSSQNLNFSQLAENIRCIPLETLPEFILPDSDNGLQLWVSDKYIVTLSSKDIRQFSPEGKFTRKLASSGKGPNEYVNLMSYTVDEQNDILYYSHRGDLNNIYAINLKDGQPAGKIKSSGHLPVQMFVTNGNISCIPMWTNQFEAFTITPSGKIIDSIPEPPAPKSAGIAGPTIRNTRLIPAYKELHLLKKDTVFKLDSGQFRAIAGIWKGDKLNSTTSTTYNIRLKNKDYFIISTSKATKANGSIILAPAITLLADAHTFKTARLDKFIIDPLEYESSETRFIGISGKKLFYVMSAFQIKNLAKEKREAGQTLSPDLQQLDEQITEESNPVIIAGDLK